MAAANCSSPAHISSRQSPPRDEDDVVVSLPDSSPPPDLSSPAPSYQQLGQVNDDLQLHPIIQMMREQELGKLVLNLAVGVTAAMLLSAGGNDDSLEFFVAHFIPFGLMTGFMAIWNGILLRAISPRLANVVEQLGISLVLILLNALVASFLPKYFSWVLWLSACLSLVPLVVSVLMCYHT